MIIWNEKLYLDDIVAKNPEKYKRILSGKKRLRGCFCITISQNPENSMEIYSSREMWFKYRKTQPMDAVGIAVCRESAFELVEKIVLDVYEAAGDVTAAHIRSFFGKSGLY